MRRLKSIISKIWSLVLKRSRIRKSTKRSLRIINQEKKCLAAQDCLFISKPSDSTPNLPLNLTERMRLAGLLIIEITSMGKRRRGMIKRMERIEEND